MKTNQDLNPQQQLAVLLVGVPMSGKTNIAMAFPSPGFLDADKNLSRVIKNYPGKEFLYETVETGPDGKLLSEEKVWLRCVEVAKNLAAEPRVKTIVIDSLTQVGNHLERYIVSQVSSSKDLLIGGEKMMALQHWGAYKTLMTRFIVALRATGKIVVVNVHEKTVEEEGKPTLFKPSIGGQMADTLPSLFTDVWRCEATPVPVDKEHPRGVRYIVRTIPHPKLKFLGTSLGLPAEFTFSWDELKKKLEVP